MESKRERNENNNVEINIDSFPKHFRKRQQSSNKKHTANFDHLLQNRNASIDLQQSLIPALQSIYKIPEENQFILLQPLLSMYIQNKYFGELMNKSRSVLIEDVENVDQIDFSSTNIGYSSTHSSPSPSSLTSQAPQDQPLDLSINKTKRSQNDIYHSLSDVLNLSNNYHNNDVVPTKSKSKRSRFKSPSIPTPKSTEHLNNYHIPTNSSSENDSDFHTSMQAFVKQEFPLFSCHICGQGFGIQDRLAKHVASCHKTRKKQSDTTKTYECEVCKRSFARSDMLTRHSRLHTGNLILIFKDILKKFIKIQCFSVRYFSR